MSSSPITTRAYLPTASSPSRSYDRSLSSPTPLSRNPVSLRIYKVLGANFDDNATKEALTTLSDLYSSPSTSNASNGTAKPKLPKRRASAYADSEDEDDEDESDEDGVGGRRVNGNGLGGAGRLSFFEGPPPGETAAKARKNLRRDIERKLAEGSQRFLKAFGEVNEKLDGLQEHITAMRTQCGEAQSQLHSTNEACKVLLDRAGSLREERQSIATRQAIVTLFLSRFTLSEPEIEALTSYDVPVGPRFFAAMDKTMKIRDDCRVLMMGDGAGVAGQDIMAATSQYLEKAYDKIFKWLSLEFRQMGKDAQLEVGELMREGVQRLRKRQELLTEAFQILSQTRQTALLNAFLTALTRGGPSGLPRPIELHAHDPLRYTGDMLAWVHQAIAAEHEFLESLIVSPDPPPSPPATSSDPSLQQSSSRPDIIGRRPTITGRMVGSVRTFGGEGKDVGRREEEEWMRELMDGAVGRVCVPLRARVLQTVRAQESSIVAYKVANLLQFYTVTMMRTIGAEAVLSRTLKEITDVSYKVFFDAIEAQGRALLRVALDPSDTDLTPPPPLLSHCQTLREILSVYDSSLLGDETPTEKEEGVRGILQRMVEPAVEMCVESAEEKARGVMQRGHGRAKSRVGIGRDGIGMLPGQREGWDKDVFVVNCLVYLLNVLEPYSFTAEKRKWLEGIVEDKVQELIQQEYNDILRVTSLQDAAHALSKPYNEPLSHHPSLQPSSLSTSLHTFSSWLSSPSVTHSARLSHLTSKSLHAQVPLHDRIHRAALRKLGRLYGRLCEEVRRVENRYEAGAVLLGGERPFGQVGLLWQILGVEEEGEGGGDEDVDTGREQKGSEGDADEKA